MNKGSEPTFVRGEQTSIIDLTFASDDLSTYVRKWKVSDQYTHSDHRAIMYEIATASGPKTYNMRKWNAKSLDREAFEVMMEGEGLNAATYRAVAASGLLLRGAKNLAGLPGKLAPRDRSPLSASPVEGGSLLVG
ncbi:hypothetical protein TSAR_015912 [Trichomalopsis sarcophagae]|uniref:Endonuclease/exonuclease/phosphatase domain-containing protein n=1 Tax=Trichomalopsis sarcophagae TaxID=543379 RepID=A0A232EF17_9HYME|nr:hypothetical protein TSAR_015912 [Trichomalopsis sarcophagae]